MRKPKIKEITDLREARRQLRDAKWAFKDAPHLPYIAFDEQKAREWRRANEAMKVAKERLIVAETAYAKWWLARGQKEEECIRSSSKSARPERAQSRSKDTRVPNVPS